MATTTRSPGPLGRLRTALGDVRQALTRHRPAEVDIRKAGAEAPTVSVIVPFHNVEPYFAECIESITTQEGPSLELILVDDGSTDASAAIAARYAQNDPRIALLSTPSLGPGGARNAGIKQARGDYFAFVDSDDRLAAGALKTLVRAIEADRVDVVVAAVTRFNSTRSWNPRWVGAIHARPRHHIDVEDFPEVIRNNYSWNKLYRRDHWLRQNLWFEDKVTFQDQPLVAQMLWRAASITVLDDVVYEYRDRDDRSSISQRTEEFANLRDRVAAWERTLAAIEADQVSEAVSSAWYRTLLQTHFHWYLSSESIADPAYWRMLREHYLALRQRFPEVSLDSIHARQRLPLTLLERDDSSTLRQLLGDGGIDALQSETAPGGSRLIPADATHPVPPDLLFTPLSALFVEATVVRGGWSSRRGELAAELDLGFKSPDRFGTPDEVQLQIRDLEGSVLFQTESGTWLADDGVDRLFELQHLVRFSAAIPATLPLGGHQLWLAVTAAGQRTHVPVTRLLAAGGAPELGSAALSGSDREVRLLPGPHGHAPILLTVDRPAVKARSVAILDDAIRLEVTADNGLKALELRSSEGRVVVAEPSGAAAGDTTVFVIALPRLTASEAGSWNVLAIDAKERKRGIRWLEGPGAAAGWPRGGDALVARATARGNLKLDVFPSGVAVAASVTVDGLLTATVVTADGRVHQEIDTFEFVALEPGAKRLFLTAPAPHPAEVPVVATPDLLAQLPAIIEGGLIVTRMSPRGLSVGRLPGGPPIRSVGAAS